MTASRLISLLNISSVSLSANELTVNLVAFDVGEMWENSRRNSSVVVSQSLLS